MSMERDFSASGLKLEGQYENDRNADSRDLFKAILREVYGATESIIAHHITYVAVDHRDGFEYQQVQEIPSADALIFDHDVARKLWGDNFKEVLCQLAMEPVATRDALLKHLYELRNSVRKMAFQEVLKGEVMEPVKQVSTAIPQTIEPQPFPLIV